MLWKTISPISARAIRRNARAVHVLSKPEAGAQTAPTYKYKFLKEPATTAVSRLSISSGTTKLTYRLSDVLSGMPALLD
jgi:hypothetical protein